MFAFTHPSLAPPSTFNLHITNSYSLLDDVYEFVITLLVQLCFVVVAASVNDVSVVTPIKPILYIYICLHVCMCEYFAIFFFHNASFIVIVVYAAAIYIHR